MTETGAALVARMLSGAWREVPPPCDMTPTEIERVTPLLSMSGGTALGWWRIKDTHLAPDAAALRGSAQMLALDDVVNQTILSELCSLLNSVGVTPLLFKGWAAAQSYPESWLRPYGDFDLLVRDDEFARARTALADAAIRPSRGDDFALPLGPRGQCTVDLHDRLDSFYAAEAAALFARARALSVSGGRFLVPSPEDHLRLCAIHMFRHGGWRPLWLCDVAAMSEAADQTFDWDICLGDRPATAAWTAAAVMLAHRLLGTRTDHLPQRVLNQCLPDWLEATVRGHWAHPHAGHFRPAGALSWRDPTASLQRRWPDAIKATIWGGGLPVPGPRLHWKLWHCATTIGRGVTRRFRQS